MYKITYVHWSESAENTLYIPGDNDYCLISGTLKLGCGQSGELDITIPVNNPAREDILCLTDEIIVYRDNEELWRGRPITQQMDFNMSGQLSCEGILSYLYDTYYPPYDFSGSPNDLLTDIIANHNSNTDEQKQFMLGNVTVTDPNDYIVRSSIDYDRTMNVLADKFSGSSLGGYFRVRISGGVRYLDYLETYGTTATQDVEYGSNILDIAQNIEYSDLATVILPLGARLTDESGVETDERLTIASVNGGSIYYTDEGAAASYGKITVCATWDDVTVASNLLEKAQEYLKQVTSAVASFEVNAVDLSLISKEYTPINLGDQVRIHSTPHGINQYAELTELDIDLLDPANDILKFGTQAASLTSNQASTTRSIQSALNSEATRITNLVATTVTTEYLSAHYATIESLNATNAVVENLEATKASIEDLYAVYATIDSLDAIYAKIGDLKAVYANITVLEADTASIKNLLAGTEVTGELTTIRLTVNNAIIDDAVIVNAVADTILAELITAGYINTNEITIKSGDDGGITIIGNQMQIVDGQLIFYDENGTVRMQIGQDAAGNFTFVLYDETGTGVMIDADGIHASAISDGLIVDSMVANDAGIQGSKLDIESVAQCLTADGTLNVSAAQVAINDTTLDAAYTEIIRQLEGLEGLSYEGLMKITTYFCLWDSDEDAPPADYDGWTTDRKIAGEDNYLWVCYLGTYADGHTEWTEPYCVTDGYLREQTTTLQTSLTVIQGEIDGRIWQTDIDEAYNALDGKITTVEDQYAELNITVDGLTADIGDLSSTVSNNYTILSTQLAEVSVTLDGIEGRITDVQDEIGTYYEEYTAKIGELTVTTDEIKASVTNVESSVTGIQSSIADIEAEIAGMEGIEDFTPYFCLWDSGYEAPPDDAGLTAAICGTAACGTTICGVTDGLLWKEEEPYSEDDSLYLWVKYKLTFQSGEVSWKGPYCLSDVATRKEVSATWAYIDVLESSITEEVGSLYTYVDGEVTTISEQVATLEITTDSITTRVSSVENTVEGAIVTMESLEKEFSELENLEDFTPYFCLWDSGTEAPPTDISELTAAICGTAVCGLTICGVTDYYSDFWSTDEPVETDGLYKWALYKLSFKSYEQTWEEWRGPYCLTDNYVRQEIRNCYSEIEQLDNRITLTVNNVSENLQSQIEQTAESITTTVNNLSENVNSQIEQLADSITSTVTKVDENYRTLSSEVSQLADSITSTVTKVDENYSTLSSEVSQLADSITSTVTTVDSNYKTLSSEISQLANSISLSVTGSLGGTAKITLSANGSSTSGSIDMANVRSAFASDKTACTISAGTVTFSSGTIVINSGNFSITSSGTASMAQANIYGTMNIYNSETIGSGTKYGTVGYKSGSDDQGNATDGVALWENLLDGYQHYFIATEAGVRMQAGPYNFYITDTGILSFTGSPTLNVGSSLRSVNLAGSGYVTLIYLGAGGTVQVGNTTYTTNVRGSTVTISGALTTSSTITTGGYICVPNGVNYYGLDNTGDRVSLTYIGTSNIVHMANGSYMTQIHGTSITSDVAISDNSDERLKTDITPLDDAYSTAFDSLLPISYRYIRNAEKLHVGFTTQNVQAALTEAGFDPNDYGMITQTEDEDGDTYSALAYSEIIAILVHEIQNLKKKVEAMA